MFSYHYGIDVTVLIFSVIMLFLEKIIYTEHNKRYYLVITGLLNLILICINSIIFNQFVLLNSDSLPEWIIYTVHNTLYSQFILELYIFYIYILNIIMCESKRVKLTALLVTIIFTILECTSNFTHLGFYITESGQIIDGQSTNLYNFAYCLFFIAACLTILKYNKVIIIRLYIVLVIASIASILISMIGVINGDTSFNTMTYLLPIIVVICLFHSNSFNSIYGLLDISSFNARVSELIKRNIPFTVVTFYIPNFDCIKNEIKTVKAYTKFTKDIQYKDFLFESAPNEYVLLFLKTVDVQDIANRFRKLHEEFQLSHQMIFIDSQNANFQNPIDYLNESKLLKMNTHESVYVATMKDIELFKKREYISSQLDSIVKNHDLNDPRVKVFCQPILNIKEERFTSAESLMRLDLPELGLVFPDQFISLAEEKNCIHTLSMIILNKVCAYIEKNPSLERISVNFSMLELSLPTFVQEVSDIINSHNIDNSKIGFEITESIDINDFIKIQQTLNDIKKLGITIYLDDFGTGYSNLEHIIRLPIDIVKFDRSLVISSAQNDKSKITVKTQAELFKNIGYKILYEGIETIEDQIMCTNMMADYLQGYRYSKPIPIDELYLFTDKNVEFV